MLDVAILIVYFGALVVIIMAWTVTLVLLHVGNGYKVCLLSFSDTLTLKGEEKQTMESVQWFLDNAERIMLVKRQQLKTEAKLLTYMLYSDEQREEAKRMFDGFLTQARNRRRRLKRWWEKRAVELDRRYEWEVNNRYDTDTFLSSFLNC